MIKFLARIRKALVPLVPAVGALVAYFASADITYAYAAGVAALVAAGVYKIPNKGA